MAVEETHLMVVVGTDTHPQTTTNFQQTKDTQTMAVSTLIEDGISKEEEETSNTTEEVLDEDKDTNRVTDNGVPTTKDC